MAKTLTEMSLEVGKSKDYFASTKSNSGKLWHWLQELDKDLVKAYRKAKQLQEEAREQVQDIIYELEDSDTTTKHSFGVWLYKRGIFKHKHSFSVLIQNKFTPTFKLSKRAYDGDILIIKAYKEYLK